MKKLFKNLEFVSGDIKNPILDADVIYTEDGVIKYVGKEKANWKIKQILLLIVKVWT